MDKVRGKTRFDSAHRVMKSGVPLGGDELYAVFLRCPQPELPSFFRAIQSALMAK